MIWQVRCPDGQVRHEGFFPDDDEAFDFAENGHACRRASDHMLECLGTCRWFALCDNEATTTLEHPVLGYVPICQRCKDKYDAMS